MADGSSDGGRAAVDAELDRDIGLVGAIALGVGTMIAAGIFVLSGLAVANVGAMAIGAFLIAAVVASFTAFAYAEFASIYPESGGGYAYVSNTFDTDLTYIVGWSMILGYPASAAFYLASFSDWFYRFILPLFSLKQAVPYWLSGLVILALLVGLNLKGTEESGKFQIVVTVVKVLLILFFLYGGLQSFRSGVVVESFTENLANLRQIGLTSALVFITFFGFEAIATNAEEIENPGRNIPRAIFISMGFVTVVYSLVVLVVVLARNDPTFLNQFLPANANLAGLSPTEFMTEKGELAMGYAAQYYLGDVGFYVIIVGALFSMLSAANATILAGSRVKLAMSRRAHLPPRFEALHDRFNTPYNSVFLTGGLIFVFILFFTVIFGGGPGSESALHLPFGIPLVGGELHLGIEAITHFADFMLLSGLVVVNLAIIYSRRKYPDVERGFHVPAVPWVPILAIIANLILVVNVEPGSFLLGLVAELIGVAFYFAVVAGPSEERIEAETPTVVTEHHTSDREHLVLVPIANPENAEQLMRTAVDVAADRDGEILAMSAVVVPEQTPLDEGRQLEGDEREVLREAMAVAEEAGVPVSGTIRISHHPEEAILNTARQYGADTILMGWGGRPPRRRDIVVGSTVDEVVADADIDVLVEKIDRSGGIESIVIPTAGGPHAGLAAETARAIAHSEGASVDVVHVVPPDADEAERAEADDVIAETATVLDDVDDVTTRMIEGEDVVDRLTEASEDYDLTVIGATRESLLERIVFGAIPEEVGRNARNTVIMAKKGLGIRSRLAALVDRVTG